ncbi:hypothetical protein [Streptomyces sp. TLI_171]|uniref:hypothetical protein n=1 Tax=Streptomyces sp. TLI_171 TaxID=1938859 RepID=UPI0037D9E9CF
MTAHILLPALDPDHPATVSPRILTGLLRHRLGFRRAGGDRRRRVRAVAGPLRPRRCGGASAGGRGRPGVPRRPRPRTEEYDALRTAVARAVRTGDLPEERLAEAAARVADFARWARALRAGARAGDGGRPPTREPPQLAGAGTSVDGGRPAGHRAGTPVVLVPPGAPACAGCAGAPGPDGRGGGGRADAGGPRRAAGRTGPWACSRRAARSRWPARRVPPQGRGAPCVAEFRPTPTVAVSTAPSGGLADRWLAPAGHRGAAVGQEEARGRPGRHVDRLCAAAEGRTLVLWCATPTGTRGWTRGHRLLVRRPTRVVWSSACRGRRPAAGSTWSATARTGVRRGCGGGRWRVPGG